MARVVLGMVGLGTVGVGVAKLLSQQSRLVLKKVAVKDVDKQRNIELKCPVTADVLEVIDDPEVEVLIEVMGGEQPALDYLVRAIEKGKHIVTANKEVLAKHGPDLFRLARQKGVAIFFEASVAGGIPLISTIHKGLEANRVSSVSGILNGTTNFILSSMEHKGESYDCALKQAQELGFAESDPTADVEGYDVAYKLSILTALSYQQFAKPEEIYRQGITSITREDMHEAKDLGYRIKLVGSTKRAEDGKVAVRVNPTLVPLDHPLASVSGGFNGILVSGDAVGDLIMMGPGAGQMPTASAVVGDAINLANALQLPDFASYFQPEIHDGWAKLASPGDWHCGFYVRLEVADAPGVIGTIGTIFGEQGVSIKSWLVRTSQDGFAKVTIVTHAVADAALQRSLDFLRSSKMVKEVESAIRILN